MKNHKRELKFDATMKNRLPPDIHPLFAIKECGCENDYFILTDDAKRAICKYGYCPYHGVCLEAS